MPEPSPPQTASNLDLRDPAIYRYWVDVTMRYSDQDAMGHVNNAVYVTWVEACRVAFIAPFLGGAPNLDFVLANLSIDFHQESRFPGTVRVGGHINRLGNTSIHSVYGVFLGDTCLASARCVNVFFDTEQRKATPPPAAVRRQIMQALGTT